MTQKLSFGVESLDEMMQGGLPRNDRGLIFGRTTDGKSVLAIQTAVMATRPEKDGGFDQNVLYICDEGDYNDPDKFAIWWKYFEKRWKLPESLRSKVHVVNISQIFELTRLFGYESVIIQSERRKSANIKFPKEKTFELENYSNANGFNFYRMKKKVVKSEEEGGKKRKNVEDKETIQGSDWMERGMAWNILKDGSYGLCVVDSISTPLKESIGSNTQNLPARNELITPLLAQFRDISLKLEVPVLHLHHSSINPQKQFAFGSVWGGDIMKYETKFIMYVRTFAPSLSEVSETIKTKYNDRLRTIMRDRLIGYDWDFRHLILEKDTGFIDFPKEAVKVRI